MISNLVDFVELVHPIPANDQARDYVNSTVVPVLTEGLTHLCKNKPAEPIVILSVTNLIIDSCGLQIGC